MDCYDGLFLSDELFVDEVHAFARAEKVRIFINPSLRPIAMSKKWQASDIPSLTGKRVLITGANSGIGYHAAIKLARKGAHVLFASRDRRKGEAATAWRLIRLAPTLSWRFLTWLPLARSATLPQPS